MSSDLGYPSFLVHITLSHMLNNNSHMNINCADWGEESTEYLGNSGLSIFFFNQFEIVDSQSCDFIS